MITAAFERDQKGSIRSFRVSGHSGYAEAGSDIICAGASTLVYTLANALERICGIDTEYSTRIEEDKGDGNIFVAHYFPNSKEYFFHKVCSTNSISLSYYSSLRIRCRVPSGRGFLISECHDAAPSG